MCEPINIVLDSKYQLLELIGEGGFAQVHRGRVLETDEPIAIKIYSGSLDEIDIPRFHREVKIMSLIDHENVIKILDHNLERSYPYIVMPLAKCSLDKCTENLKNSEEQTLDIFLKACEGVKEIHKKGIYHRDIKPSNILISQSDEILIADLGLARIKSTEPITPDYDWIGTEMYTPPEYYSRDGYKNADAKGDIFQLGKTLYNLLTGRTPGLLEWELLSPGLQVIIAKAIKDKPTDRYQSVDEFTDIINYYLNSLKPSSNPADLCESYLDALNKLPPDEIYDPELVEKMLTSLYTCKDNDEIFLNLFDMIPLNLVESLAKDMGVTFQMILEEYSIIMNRLAEDFNLNFSYADVISKRMEVIYMCAPDIQNKTTALRVILKISITANRYPAMNSFGSILKRIKDPNEGLAISLMLKNEIKDYSKLLRYTKVPILVSELHYSLREITREAINFSSN